jgi:hypothetical protein
MTVLNETLYIEIDAPLRPNGAAHQIYLTQPGGLADAMPIVKRSLILPNRIEGASPGRIETTITIDNTPGLLEGGFKFSDFDSVLLLRNAKISVFVIRANASSAYGGLVVWRGLIDDFQVQGDECIIRASTRPPADRKMAMLVEEPLWDKYNGAVGTPEKFFGRYLPFHLGSEWYSRPVIRQDLQGGVRNHYFYYATSMVGYATRYGAGTTFGVNQVADLVWIETNPIEGVTSWFSLGVGQGAPISPRPRNGIASTPTTSATGDVIGFQVFGWVENIYQWTQHTNIDVRNCIIENARVSWKYTTVAPTGSANGYYQVNIYATPKNVSPPFFSTDVFTKVATSSPILSSDLRSTWASGGTTNRTVFFRTPVAINHDAFNYFIGVQAVPEDRSTSWGSFQNDQCFLMMDENPSLLVDVYRVVDDPALNGQHVQTITGRGAPWITLDYSDFWTDRADEQIAAPMLADPAHNVDIESGLIASRLRVRKTIYDVNGGSWSILFPSLGAGGANGFDLFNMTVQGHSEIEGSSYGTTGARAVYEVMLSQWDGTGWVSPNPFVDIGGYSADMETGACSEKFRNPAGTWEGNFSLDDLLNDIGSQGGYRLVAVPAASNNRVDYQFYAYGSSLQAPVLSIGPNTSRILSVTAAPPESAIRDLQIVKRGSSAPLTGSRANFIVGDPNAEVSTTYNAATGGIYGAIRAASTPYPNTRINPRDVALQGVDRAEWLAYYWGMRYGNAEVIIEIEITEVYWSLKPTDLIEIQAMRIPGHGSSEKARPITYLGVDVEHQWQTGTPGTFPGGICQVSNVIIVIEGGVYKQIIAARLLTHPTEWIR